MITQELINFIKSQLEKGVNRSEIEDQLLKNGWLKADIDSAFNLATAPTMPTTAPTMPMESEQIQSIQPEQAQPSVSEPVFEIKPNLTNEPTVQQPDFQFSQENQKPEPIQPFKVPSLEDSQPLGEKRPIESNLTGQDQNIFEPPLGQNQFQPQILKEEIPQRTITG